MKGFRHYGILTGVLLLGAILRFWNLDLKPVWLDEVITALFSLGRNYYNVPLEQAFSLSNLNQVFTLNSETTCAQIVQTVSTQSVHPPLFFCWMHSWMRWLNTLPQSWIWKLRALPALVGVISIAAVYQLNRVAFSPQAGLMGAAVMAVSPFAVYLAQEARHYTLPMLLVILALLGLYQLHTDLYQRQFRPAIWLSWVIVNSVGFYVHYFFLIAFAAQVLTLVVNVFSLKSIPTLHAATARLNAPRLKLGPKAHIEAYTLNPRLALTTIALATAGVCLTYLPWLPTMVSHLSRPETDWLKPFEPHWTDKLAPLYQIPSHWILMVIALPLEKQPKWVVILSVLLMLVFVGWLVWQLASRFAYLWSNPDTHLAARMLVVFILCVLLEFLAIVYILGKDITLVPRYNFIYFPAVCALLGASLVQPGRIKAKGKRQKVKGNQQLIFAVLLAGIVSSSLVVTNQVFLKPYIPDRVARNMMVQPQRPLLVTMAYTDLQDVALGLSFALALQQQANQSSASNSFSSFALLSRSPNYAQVWQTLARLNQALPIPLDLWVIGPDLRRADYPQQLLMQKHSETEVSCKLDPAYYHRVGVPYQLYRCVKEQPA